MWWVYFVRCEDGTLYAGVASDLQRRLREHNGGKRGAKYTAARLPITLAQAWQVPDRSAALRLEAVLKKCDRLEKQGLIEDPGKIYALAERRSLKFPIIVNNVY